MIKKEAKNAMDLILSKLPYNGNIKNKNGDNILAFALKHIFVEFLIPTIVSHTEFEDNVNEAFYHSYESRSLLIKQKSFRADVSVEGEYPFFTVLGNIKCVDCVDLVERILERSECNPNIVDENGRTAIHHLVLNYVGTNSPRLYYKDEPKKIARIIQLLTKHHVDLQIKDGDGKTILDYAAANYSVSTCDLVQYLLSIEKFDNIEPIVQVAITRFDNEMLEYLISAYKLDVEKIKIDAMEKFLKRNTLYDGLICCIKLVLTNSKWDINSPVDRPVLERYYEQLFNNYMIYPNFHEILLLPAKSFHGKSISWFEFGKFFANSFKAKHNGWIIESLRWIQDKLKDELVYEKSPVEFIVFKNFLKSFLEFCITKPDIAKHPNLQKCHEIINEIGAEKVASKIKELLTKFQDILFFIYNAKYLSAEFMTMKLLSAPVEEWVIFEDTRKEYYKKQKETLQIMKLRKSEEEKLKLAEEEENQRQQRITLNRKNEEEKHKAWLTKLQEDHEHQRAYYERVNEYLNARSQKKYDEE